MKRTAYMAASDIMKERVISEMTSRKEEASRIRSVLNLINSFDIACFSDLGFGVKFYNWLTKEEYSTPYLREISACVGYDYWDGVEAMSAIDELDTISAKYGKIK